MYTPDHHSHQHENPYQYGTQNAADWESKRQTAIAQEQLYQQQISYHEAERKRQQEQSRRNNESYRPTNNTYSKPTATSSSTASSSSSGFKNLLTFAAFVIGGFYTLGTTEDWVAAFFAGGILALIVNKAYKLIKVIAIVLIILLILSALL